MNTEERAGERQITRKQLSECEEVVKQKKGWGRVIPDSYKGLNRLNLSKERDRRYGESKTQLTYKGKTITPF